MWTHTRLGKWPRVRQRETTVRIHAKADATTTTTTRHTNSRCTNMMTSWHFQTYPSLYQCNSSYRRGGHRGTAPVTDPRWQETFQTSSRPASFPRGSFAPRWLNSPSSNKKQIRHLAVRRWSFLRLSVPLPWEWEGAGWHLQKGSAVADQTKWPGERKEGRERSRRDSTLEQTCGSQTPCEGLWSYAASAIQLIESEKTATSVKRNSRWQDLKRELSHPRRLFGVPLICV